MISIILYIKGLEGCVGDEVFCLERMGFKFFQKIVVIILFSCSIVSIILILITFRKLSFFHLFYSIPSYIILIYYDQGQTLENHGYYNSLGFIFLLIVLYPHLIFITIKLYFFII